MSLSITRFKRKKFKFHTPLRNENFRQITYRSIRWKHAQLKDHERWKEWSSETLETSRRKTVSWLARPNINNIRLHNNIYYIDKSVFLENTPHVKFLGNSSGVFWQKKKVLQTHRKSSSWENLRFFLSNLQTMHGSVRD